MRRVVLRNHRLAGAFPPGTILAAGMCIALAERYSNAFLEYSKLQVGC